MFLDQLYTLSVYIGKTKRGRNSSLGEYSGSVGVTIYLCHIHKNVEVGDKDRLSSGTMILRINSLYKDQSLPHYFR